MQRNIGADFYPGKLFCRERKFNREPIVPEMDPETRARASVIVLPEIKGRPAVGRVYCLVGGGYKSMIARIKTVSA